MSSNHCRFPHAYALRLVSLHIYIYRRLGWQNCLSLLISMLKFVHCSRKIKGYLLIWRLNIDILNVPPQTYLPVIIFIQTIDTIPHQHEWWVSIDCLLYIFFIVLYDYHILNCSLVRGLMGLAGLLLSRMFLGDIR